VARLAQNAAGSAKDALSVREQVLDTKKDDAGNLSRFHMRDDTF